MGEAKRRGTFEQRKAEAQAKNGKEAILLKARLQSRKGKSHLSIAMGNGRVSAASLVAAMGLLAAQSGGKDE